jgi:hypothetical protein
METSSLSFADIPVEETLNYAFELYGETIKESSRLQILALPAKWWKEPCSNFPDGIGWQS